MAQPWATQIRQPKTAVLHEEAVRIAAGRVAVVYENHEFDVAGSIITPKSIRDPAFLNHATSCSCGRGSGPFNATSGAFALLPFAQRLSVRNVGQTGGSADKVTVRCSAVLGDTTNVDLVTIDPGESGDFDMQQIADLFFTTPGVATRVRVRFS